MGEKGLLKDAKRIAWDSLVLKGYRDAIQKWAEEMHEWRKKVHAELYEGGPPAGPQPQPSDFDQWTLANEMGFNSATGQNAAWDEDKGAWINTKTGTPLTPPLIGK